eukprot:5747771-Pyramimonas_sp.AAC.2
MALTGAELWREDRQTGQGAHLQAECAQRGLQLAICCELHLLLTCRGAPASQSVSQSVSQLARRMLCTGPSSHLPGPGAHPTLRSRHARQPQSVPCLCPPDFPFVF